MIEFDNFSPHFFMHTDVKDWIMLCKLWTTVVPGNIQKWQTWGENSVCKNSITIISWEIEFLQLGNNRASRRRTSNWTTLMNKNSVLFVHRNAIPSINSFDVAQSAFRLFCLHSSTDMRSNEIFLRLFFFIRMEQHQNSCSSCRCDKKRSGDSFRITLICF